jgi:hypothetical protein
MQARFAGVARRRMRHATLGVGSLVALTAGADAQDCHANYAYAASPSNTVQTQLTAARGKTVSVNRSDMLYFVNTAARKIEIQVTIPTGGSKWVALDKSQRDPPALNYVGNVTLQQVKCHYLYSSPVAMYTASVNAAGPYPNQVTIAQAVIQEFGLSATQFLNDLQPHITALTAARVLHDTFNHTPSQIASVLKQRGYQVAVARDALWAASTESERAAISSVGGVNFPWETPILLWLKAPYGGTPAAQAMYGATLYGSVPTDLEKLARMMKGAQYTPAEAVKIIRQLKPQGGAGIATLLYPGGNSDDRYSLSELAQGLAAEFGAPPPQVAQWLVAAAGELSIGLYTAPVGLSAFSQNRAQITAWMVQGGFPLAEVAKGMARSQLAATHQQIVAGFKLANVDVQLVVQALEEIRASRFMWTGSQITAEEIRSTIRQVGYPAGPAAIAFKQAYGAGNSIAESHILAFWLMQAGYDAKGTVDGMRAAYPGDAGPTTADRLRHPTAEGFVANTNQPLALRPEFAAAGLKASYGAPNAQVASWLDAPWKHLEQAFGIYTSLTKSGADVAAWMKNSRTPKEIGQSLFVVVTTDPARVASHVRAAGFSPPDAAEAIRYMAVYAGSQNISQSPDKVAVAMRDGGFSLDAIFEGIGAQFPQVTQREILGWVCATGTTKPASNTSGMRTGTATCPSE